jgi:predicted protein tyrosine phosphatase
LFRSGKDTLEIAKLLRIHRPNGTPNEARVVELLDYIRGIGQMEEAS